MSTDAGNGEPLAGSRIHIPGRPDPNVPEFRHMVVRDAKGHAFAMPYAYMAALDENAAKQIHAIAYKAAMDAMKDFHRSIHAMTAAALTPPNQSIEKDDENPGRMCAAPLATGMCNKRRAEHPIEGHEYTPGAMVVDDQGVVQLEIPPPADDVPRETPAQESEAAASA